jgi:hypothetical protein
MSIVLDGIYLPVVPELWMMQMCDFPRHHKLLGRYKIVGHLHQQASAGAWKLRRSLQSGTVLEFRGLECAALR